MIEDQTLPIREICYKAYESLARVYEQGLKTPFTFKLDLATLQDYNFIDIRTQEPHASLFTTLADITGPVLYFFEVISEHTSTEILAAIDSYKMEPDCKAIPAIKTTPNHDTKVLYVGKVKTQFWGRLIQHLGFYKVSRTQGLQLYYWAKPLKLKLKVHLYEFQPDMANLMPIVENAMAVRLKPLLGKHK